MEDLQDDVASVPLTTAAKVIGVPRRRLLAWADRDLLRPSYDRLHGRAHVSGYRLDDIVVGRIIRQLEAAHGVHIRQITQIVHAVRTVLGHEYPLGSLIWAVSGTEAFVQFPDETWFGGRRPNHARITGVLDLQELRAEVRRSVQRPKDEAGRSDRQRGVRGSREVFAGSRVPVDTVVRYVQAGFDDERILNSFPSLFAEDVALARHRAAS